MAGTLATTIIQNGVIQPVIPTGSYEVSMAWTSTAGGAVSASALTASGNPLNVFGTLLRAVSIPGTGGDAPTTGFDVSLATADGIDLLSGEGQNLTTANTEIAPMQAASDGSNDAIIPRQVDGQFTLTVTQAGSAKSGVLVVYMKR